MNRSEFLKEKASTWEMVKTMNMGYVPAPYDVFLDEVIKYYKDIPLSEL